MKLPYYNQDPYNSIIIDEINKKPNITNDNCAIIYQGYDSPGKKDSTYVFRKEAENFCDCYALNFKKVTYGFNKCSGRYRRFESVLEFMDSRSKGTQNWIFLCHGGSSWLGIGAKLPGFSTRDARMFIKLIDIIVSKHVAPNVILFSCLTSEDLYGRDEDDVRHGDNSFADCVRDFLCSRSAIYCRVVAHRTRGHATVNPYVDFVEGNGSIVGGVGSLQVPGKNLRSIFKKKLDDRNSDFRFRFPFMTIRAIHEELLL